MATVGETVLDLYGGAVTVAVEYDDATRRVSMVAVTNSTLINEKPSPLHFVLGGIDVMAPTGYSETRFDRNPPLLPADWRALSPRMEVRFNG